MCASNLAVERLNVVIPQPLFLNGGIIVLIKQATAVSLEVPFPVFALFFLRAVLHAVMNRAFSHKTLNFLPELMLYLVHVSADNF
jgi:hypothetical protein